MLVYRRVSLALLFIAVIAAGVQAQSLRESTSLRFVPAKASFYSTSLRIRDQFLRIARSRAVAKVHAMPIVQQGLQKLQEEWQDGDFRELREFVQAPENQPLVQVLLDGVSNEIFVYGDARHGKWLGTLGRMGNTINLAQLQAAQRGEEPDEAIQKALLEILEKDPDLLRVPATVIGFKLRDKEPALSQLARLEQFLRDSISAEAPQLADRLSRQKIGQGDYLTLRLDGTLVPWDEVLEDTDLDADTQDKLVQKLRQVTFQIALGLYEDYLILAFGEDSAPLESLGSGELLVDHPKLAPLAKHFDQPVTGIGYVSQEFLQQVSGISERMDQMRDMFKSALPAAPISPEIQADLAKDADRMFDQIKQLQPRLGAASAISFEVPEGFDSYSYSWTEQRTLDDSKPLTILKHVGGDPIGFYASRNKASEGDQEFLREWMPKIGQYLERIGGPMLDSQQKELYEEVKKRMLPLLGRLDQATREQLRPAFADGQSAIVLDAKVTSQRWHMAMPRSQKPLALPEVACVWSLSDREKLVAGLTEYFDVLQATITAMSEIMPDQIPPLQLPSPESDEAGAGKVYYYPLPPFLGVDPSLALNAGISDDTFAVSLLPKVTERLLKETALERSGPLEGAADRPLAVAWQFKFHRLVGMARPWVDYALEVAAEQGQEVPKMTAEIETVMDVLECIQTASGIGYFEDDAFVTHSRMEFQDLRP